MSHHSRWFVKPGARRATLVDINLDGCIFSEDEEEEDFVLVLPWWWF
ncbi:MAG TPA: hypothetical protein VEY13_09525 [Rubrobacteraceae bacterium]|nr:hypothetical protein [Rubrobacteraceae bacterium]